MSDQWTDSPGTSCKTAPILDPPVIRPLDFFEFHPLDHSLLRCTGYHGGRRLHWQ